ncbi:hypothetical protein BJ741DRAFT_587715 [Chytriomyces cf. hyalinus JEL632]|nr:hypothetical protein BJ741DRAFT_587715 [Chytriomyces cf. hyalinus JEL632]
MARINVDNLMRDLDRSIQQFQLDAAAAAAGTASLNTPETTIETPAPSPHTSLADLLKSNEPDAITGYLDCLTAAAASPPRDQHHHQQPPVQFETRFFALAADGMFMFNSARPSESLLDSIHVSAVASFVSHMPPLCFAVTDKINGKSWILSALTKTAKNVWLSKLNEVVLTNHRADNASDYSDLMGSYLDNDETGGEQQTESVYSEIVHQRFNQRRISSIRSSDRQPEGIHEPWQQQQQAQPYYRPAVPMYTPNNNNEQSSHPQYRPVAMARVLSDQGADLAYTNYLRRNQDNSNTTATQQFPLLRKGSTAYSAYSSDGVDPRWNARSLQESTVPPSSSSPSLSMAGIPGGGIFGKESPGLELERSLSSPVAAAAAANNNNGAAAVKKVGGNVKRMKSARGQIAATFVM